MRVCIFDIPISEAITDCSWFLFISFVAYIAFGQIFEMSARLICSTLICVYKLLVSAEAINSFVTSWRRVCVCLLCMCCYVAKILLKMLVNVLFDMLLI